MSVQIKAQILPHPHLVRWRMYPSDFVCPRKTCHCGVNWFLKKAAGLWKWDCIVATEASGQYFMGKAALEREAWSPIFCSMSIQHHYLPCRAVITVWWIAFQNPSFPALLAPCFVRASTEELSYCQYIDINHFHDSNAEEGFVPVPCIYKGRELTSIRLLGRKRVLSFPDILKNRHCTQCDDEAEKEQISAARCTMGWK